MTMKKKILSAVLALCLAFGSAAALPQSAVVESTSITASAEGETKKSGNYEYTILKDGTAEITKYNGKETKVAIPSKLGGKKVTSIGATAFSECTSLKSVTIPNSVTSIGDYAFSGSGLKSITIPNSVTSIGDSAFWDCTSLSSVNIPSSVESVGDYVFYGCTSLTSVTIPNSVKSIGDGAFYGCTRLTSITIPSSVKSIGYEAFKGTKWLENKQKQNPFVIVNGILIDGTKCSGKVTIPNSVTSIGDCAFRWCTSLTSITIPNGVTSIGDYAFQGCVKLTSITIPSSVKSIGVGAFYACQSLKSVTIPSSVTNIDAETFSHCTSLTSVTIPNSVTSIGNNAFYECKKLESISLSKNLKSLGEEAFSDCTKLKTISLPDSLVNMGDGVFGVCSGLKSVKLGKNVKDIPIFCFSGCSSLENVVIPNGVKSIGYHAFAFCTGLKNVSFPETLETLGPGVFLNCSSLQNVILPKSLKNFDHDAQPPFWFDLYMPNDGLRFYYYKGTASEKEFKPYQNSEQIYDKPVRFAGSDRAETATKISKAVNAKTSDTVILATGFDFHDALAAVPLASAYNAPLLLADRDNLSAKTLAEIKRLKAKNIIVVASTNSKDQNGNDAAIGKNVYNQLKGYNVTKLVGSSYYETAKKVAQQLQKKTNKAPNYVFFTTDKNYADALSVSPVAAILKAPIFYVDPKGKLNANTTYYLNSVKSSVKKVFIIGGTNAISKDVVKKIKAVLPGKTVQRFAGADRYDTCLRINNAFSGTLTGLSVCVAKGYNFPDALAGGVFAAKMRSPLLLADNSIDSRQTKYLKSKKTLNIYVFGGTKAVPASLVNTISKACK